MLNVNNISFSYDDKLIIDKVSFNLSKGENLAIIGESGCGKSTLLKLLYGIYDLNSGEIKYNETLILGPKFNLIPGPQFMKYLAQDFDLMPYITVAENVGKFLSNIEPQKKASRVSELLEMVEMVEFANVKPKSLSGGQQQRVALARVLALEPEILLLDEPFSNIDNFKKNNLRRNLFEYLKQKQISCIIATHDGADALSFADDTFIIKKGKKVMYGNSKSLYLKPINKYVASLFGEANEINVNLLMPYGDDKKTILIYSHEFDVVQKSTLKVKIETSYYKGNQYLVKAFHLETILFFESKTEIPKGKTLFLDVNINTIKSRL